MQYLAFCKDLDSCDQDVYKVETRNHANLTHTLAKGNTKYILRKKRRRNCGVGRGCETAGMLFASRLIA
ncbi:hypothetical protein NCCP2331_16770 [Sporosarcina sp. NCCP-2331]|nr:hypothetical protein NCCP2331_16770 [Sporosarcina sp. NCCP-2331]GLB55649.1 hypothetical protein NCCP2378_14360 [Sporosarcina sp. NCCP-2378]